MTTSGWESSEMKNYNGGILIVGSEESESVLDLAVYRLSFLQESDWENYEGNAGMVCDGGCDLIFQRKQIAYAATPLHSIAWDATEIYCQGCVEQMELSAKNGSETLQMYSGTRGNPFAWPEIQEVVYSPELPGRRIV